VVTETLLQESELGIRGVLYILTYKYNYKLLPDVTQYYKNITSSIGANARIQRDIQV